MLPLIVEVAGRTLRFDGSSLVRIGRSADADVVLAAGSVSRSHAELRPVADGWVLVDSGSQFGTFVDGRRITEHRIDGPTEVRCGADSPGSRLTVRLSETADGPPVPPAPPAAPPPVDDGPTSFFPPSAPPVGPPPSAPPPAGPPPSRIAPPAPDRPAAETPPAAPPPAATSVRPTGPAPSTPPPSGTVVRPTSAPPPSSPPAADRPATPVAPPATPDGFEQTMILAGGAVTGAPAAPGAPPMPPSGPDLMIVADGEEHRFRHPAQISIGRRPDCTVVLTDPAASRVHGHVAASPHGWTYTNASNEGTYVDGKKVTSLDFDESTTLRLGHPVAGPELQLIPLLSAAAEEKRIAGRRRGRRLKVVGGVLAAAVVVIALVIGSLFVFNNEENGPTAGPPSGGDAPTGDTMAQLTDDELDSAKAATVYIQAETTDSLGRTVQYSGSGSIIDSEGLILTNAHVAAPAEPALKKLYGDSLDLENPDYLAISLTGANDMPAEPEYRARLVEASGQMDAAVIQIYSDADGNDLTDPLDLPSRPLGDSDDVSTGDPVTVLGFPGISQSKAVTVTTGVVSTFIDGPFGPRSEIDTDARIAPGNSGGMAIDNDANIIGIPSAVAFDSSSPIASGRIRPINVVADLIDDAESKVG